MCKVEKFLLVKIDKIMLTFQERILDDKGNFDKGNGAEIKEEELLNCF